jgi:hypothetical protein
MTYKTGMPSWHSHCTGPLGDCRRTSVPQFIKFRRSVLPVAAAALLVAAIPSPAEAQQAQPRSAVPHPAHGPAYGPHYRPYYSYPYYWHSVWWASFGYPWAFSFYGYPYGYGYGFGYGYPYPYGYYPVDITTAIRLQVTPREAEVFVDGYSAGVVDNFDGVFQRLRVQPGGHEIAVYLDGYRTFRQNIHLSPGSSQTIRHELERLTPGEIMEPRPSPSMTPSMTTNDGRPDAPSLAGPERQYDPRPRQEPPAERERTAREEPRERFGTLSIRVQPSDAEILVDGERWTAPADSSRITIELTQGRHTVEVRKAGFSVYREDVLIRPGAATNVNVSLTQ